jgi:hypothetical protein
MKISYLKFYVFFSLIAVAHLSCTTEKKKPLFLDLPSGKSGIEFSNTLVNSDSFNMVDFLYYYDGGGLAVGDINQDGLPDIYFTSNEGNNALYLNKGGLQFEDITESAGVASSGAWKSGVSMVDVNGDGRLDIYVCRLGDYKGVKGHNELYINQGDLTFVEEASRFNLDFVGYSTQAAFFDMENDGDLDVYLLNHSVHTSGSFGSIELRNDIDSLAGDRLYRNDNGYFNDITAASGIYTSQVGYGLGIGLTDVNRDGFTDIYISNDFLENDYLYVNNGDGTFKESFASMTTHTSLSSMGNDLADFNNDGLVDIITLDMLPQDEIVRKSTVGDDPQDIFRMKMSFGYMKQYSRNTLQLNRGNGSFSEIGMLAGVHSTDWSWSPLFADLNNDGLKDLFISNGIVGRPNDLAYIDFIERPDIKGNPNIKDKEYLDNMPGGAARNYFIKNNGDLTFSDMSGSWSTDLLGITNGTAYVDLDNDGDLDIVMNNLNRKSILKENLSRKDSLNHFLNIELVGIGLNSKSIGSNISVYTMGQLQFFEVFPVRGFKSSGDTRIHVGLGNNERADSILIHWPDGKLSALYNVRADQFIKINQANAGERQKVIESYQPMFSEVPVSEIGIDYKHQENRFIEFNREALIPHMNSMEGPALAVGDLNGDGLDDFYLGGAKHQEGQIYVQKSSGFVSSSQKALIEDKTTEDVDAELFDFDNDGDLDLLVVSGGNEFSGEDFNRQPRLYLNDGDGGFVKADGIFQDVYQNGSVVAVHDFDGDGWSDIFLGTLTVPWNYGVIPKSYLLRNLEGEALQDVSDLLKENGQLGMINDASWADLDGNGQKDLVLAGEWMNIKILLAEDGKFKAIEIPNSSGWWKSIDVMDADGDGDMDLIGGNLGLNTKLRASSEYPVKLLINDFDKNGKLDQVMTYAVNGKESIYPSYRDITKQIPAISDRFATAREYASATIQELFGKDDLNQASVLISNEMRSGIFINENGKFLFHPFKNEAQLSWIQDILLDDINIDGRIDILTGGNSRSSTIQEGWYLADQGSLLLNESEGFMVRENFKIGLSLKGEIREMKIIEFQNRKHILVARNNDSIQLLRAE